MLRDQAVRPRNYDRRTITGPNYVRPTFAQRIEMPRALKIFTLMLLTLSPLGVVRAGPRQLPSASKPSPAPGAAASTPEKPPEKAPEKPAEKPATPAIPLAEIASRAEAATASLRDIEA